MGGFGWNNPGDTEFMDYGQSLCKDLTTPHKGRKRLFVTKSGNLSITIEFQLLKLQVHCTWNNSTESESLKFLNL